MMWAFKIAVCKQWLCHSLWDKRAEHCVYYATEEVIVEADWSGVARQSGQIQCEKQNNYFKSDLKTNKLQE